MCPISDITGSIGYGETPWEVGDFAETSTRKTNQDLIKRADSVSITKVFRHYNLYLNEINRKAVCPIPSHKNGRESSASFYYYPQTNTFWCFGCKTGIGCSDFVASMDGTTKIKAARKIIEWLGAEISLDENNEYLDRENYSEKLEIMLDFSDAVREFRYAHFNEKDEEFIENICAIYDALNTKHKLDNAGLRSMVEQLKEEISLYQSI